MLPEDGREQLLDEDAASPARPAERAGRAPVNAAAPRAAGVVAPGLRLRGGDASDCPMCTCGFLTVFFFFVYMFMCQSIEPNQFGLIKNSVTGVVDTNAVRGGLRFTGPFGRFLTFPATQVTLSFKPSGGDRAAIQARTGQDVDAADSDAQGGGQPIVISCAFQFQIVPENLRLIYLSFGTYEAARLRWLLLSGNMISNIAQQFTPQDFWTSRKRITDTLLNAVNHTLWNNGYVLVTKFQIIKVDFVPLYEESITGVQVAEQQRVVNEYEQQTQTVVQSIAVLEAQNNAIIANISASAEAFSRELVAHAYRDAFHLKQDTKADKYSELRSQLAFDGRHMHQYFKIKALQTQETQGEVVVGMPQIGSGSQLPHVEL